MENCPQHPVVALQFNLGAAPRSNQKQKAPSTSVKQGNGVSVHVGRHLIYQYLKQSIISDPAFIASQDELSNVDVEAIRKALHERSRSSGGTYECTAWHCHKEGKEALPQGKKAALLYDKTVMTYDKANTLVEDDFFNPRDNRAQRLFARLDGGLFLHAPSKRFIVAVSYHGEKNGSKDDEKKTYILGRGRRLSLR